MPRGLASQGAARVTSLAFGTKIDYGNKANGTTVTPALDQGSWHRFTATGAGVTIAAPVAGDAGSTADDGELLFIDVSNTSGGALTITWNAAFRQAATAPADTKRRVYMFIRDDSAAKWVQVGTGLDV